MPVNDCSGKWLLVSTIASTVFETFAVSTFIKLFFHKTPGRETLVIFIHCYTVWTSSKMLGYVHFHFNTKHTKSTGMERKPTWNEGVKLSFHNILSSYSATYAHNATDLQSILEYYILNWLHINSNPPCIALSHPLHLSFPHNEISPQFQSISTYALLIFVIFISSPKLGPLAIKG